MPTQRPTRTKAQQRAETTQAVLTAARKLFASKGYAHVSLAEIADVAGVTKGALYHYFSGKEDLFRAVLKQVHNEVAARIDASGDDADPWTQLVTGCTTFLTATAEPGLQRIMLIDAPAVVGWERWRELDASTSMRQLTDVLRRLIDEGVITDQPVEPLAHLLSGAMNEAAMWLADSDDSARDLADTVIALTRLLGSLRYNET